MCERPPKIDYRRALYQWWPYLPMTVYIPSIVVNIIIILKRWMVASHLRCTSTTAAAIFHGGTRWMAVEHINCEMVHIDPSISNERLIKQIRVLGVSKTQIITFVYSTRDVITRMTCILRSCVESKSHRLGATHHLHPRSAYGPFLLPPYNEPRKFIEYL